jgi:hypothetical protein
MERMNLFTAINNAMAIALETDPTVRLLSPAFVLFFFLNFAEN